MQIDTTSPAGQAFIADHIGCDVSALTSEDILIFEHDECMTCEICGQLFTDRHDFELDALDVYGTKICVECDASGDAEDTIDFHREFGTWRSL